MLPYRSRRIEKPKTVRHFRQDDGGSASTSGIIHRIDRSHRKPQQTLPAIESTSNPSAEIGRQITGDLPPESLLKLHGEELIERLQNWAADLDAREATLNSRAALQEHRERQFRVQQQSTLAELAEQARAAKRAEVAIRHRARQMAFEVDES
ncbi:hypothetical protein CA13_68350 [Planctomycetes bacterium CA13]|uniref:Uncharacterized protein n=1 Tax=Novipirellula herctigrandis TaxID=2527986 RepID=A0A5C5YN34_9BACT|nr:hypothetical protein CA13_68350 [Planctomycetes bacterium CA13]